MDCSYAERIIAALGDISHATVLEIGPGHGVLTDFLAERAERLIAIELDRVLAAQLRMKYANRPDVELIEGDVLTMDLAAVLRQKPGILLPVTLASPSAARVVGNIPYYITSDILLRLFSRHALIEQIVIMVQREVADRIAASPGSRDYGLLSATAQLYAKVEKLFTVPAGAFSPPPKVLSTALRLTIAPQFKRLNVAEEDFIAFLKLGFGQKRKTLFNNLRLHYDDSAIRGALRQTSLRPDVRAEALSLDKSASLFRHLSRESSPRKEPI